MTKNSAACTLLTLAALGFGCGGGAATAVDTVQPEREETVSKDLPFKGGDFTLTNKNGAVTVQAWDQETAQIVARKSMKISAGGGFFGGPPFDTAAQADAHFAALAMNVQAAEDKIVVETEYPDQKKNVNLEVQYEVKVPRNTSVEITTANGAVRVVQVQQEVKIETTNGEVNVTGVGADIEAQTDNGAITIADSTGGVNADTSNGKITITTTAPADGDITASTDNGAIEVTLPADTPFDLEAETTNGNVSTGFTLAEGATQSQRKIEGKVGDGGRDLSLETKNGNITINPL